VTHIVTAVVGVEDGATKVHWDSIALHHLPTSKHVTYLVACPARDCDVDRRFAAWQFLACGEDDAEPTEVDPDSIDLASVVIPADFEADPMCELCGDPFVCHGVEHVIDDEGDWVVDSPYCACRHMEAHDGAMEDLAAILEEVVAGRQLSGLVLAGVRIEWDAQWCFQLTTEPALAVVGSLSDRTRQTTEESMTIEDKVRRLAGLLQLPERSDGELAVILDDAKEEFAALGEAPAAVFMAAVATELAVRAARSRPGAGDAHHHIDTARAQAQACLSDEEMPEALLGAHARAHDRAHARARHAPVVDMAVLAGIAMEAASRLDAAREGAAS
jgi:hypothetical protein